MFGVAAFGGRIERRAARSLSSWTRDYLRAVALAGLGCGVVGGFIAARVRSGGNVTSVYLALPVLWVAALVMLAPLSRLLIATVWRHERGPALFSQIRVQRLAGHDSDGVPFTASPSHTSLAGPHPAIPEEAGKYAEHARHRLVSKPGLTGLWQAWRWFGGRARINGFRP